MTRNIIAILRGVRPPCFASCRGSDFGRGAKIMPLNSPVHLIGDAGGFGDQALIGAGTVLETAQVAKLEEIGARRSLPEYER